MRRIRFVGGQRLLMDGVPITLNRIVSVGTEEVWEVENRAKRQVDQISRREIEIALLEGRLVDDTGGARPAKRYAGVRAFSDLPKKAQQRIYFERAIIQGVAEQTTTGMKTCKDPKTGQILLKSILLRLSHDLGIKYFGTPRTLSVTQYYSYCKKHQEAFNSDELAGGYHNRGRKEQMGPGVRELVIRTIEDVIAEWKGKQNKPGFTLLTMRRIEDRIVRSVEIERQTQDDSTLRVPSRSTIYRIISKEINQYDYSLVSKGRILTESENRRPGQQPRKLTYALQWYQFDETRCPIFLYDNERGIPLGKPWLSWIVDVFSDSILGFYVGFEPPGDLVIAQTLRHACLPKAYMNSWYPKIKKPIIQAGIPNLLTFDNSLQAHGNSIQQICGDLDILFDFTRARSPWMKSKVERMFQKLEQEITSDLPGYTFPPFWKIPQKDYDPQKTAILDFSTFMNLIHAWIALMLHDRPRGRKASPNERWIEGTRAVEPEFIPDTAELDALFGIVRKGRRLDSRGVSFEGLTYYSDEIHRQRLFAGATQKVDIKCNPLDLRRIRFRASDGSWLPAVTHDHADMERLDLHTLKLLNTQARHRYGVETVETRVQCMRELEAALCVGYNDGMTAANASRAARVLGIGSHYALAAQRPNGQIVIDRQAPSSETQLHLEDNRLAKRPQIPTFVTDRSLS